jgi:hypothetical protein
VDARAGYLSWESVGEIVRREEEIDYPRQKFSTFFLTTAHKCSILLCGVHE